jgi:hypothetical protein
VAARVWPGGVRLAPSEELDQKISLPLIMPGRSAPARQINPRISPDRPGAEPRLAEIGSPEFQPLPERVSARAPALSRYVSLTVPVMDKDVARRLDLGQPLDLPSVGQSSLTDR